MKENELYKFNPPGSDLRIAQEHMFDMLVSFDKFCKANDIEYWIDSGTLLGAVRHGGFIPWDDDIDIGMTRVHAKRLESLLKDDMIAGQYVLQTSKSDSCYVNSSWMTLRDTKSEYIQDLYLHNRLKYRGLQIDIFVFEYGVSLFLKRLATIYNIWFVKRLLMSKKITFLRPLAYPNYRFFENVIAPVMRLIKYNNKINKGYGNPFGKPYDKSTLFPLRKVTFEGYDFPAPNDVDTYLVKMYGDWKKIPDVEHIHTHDVRFKFID